ncbi:MAG: hypothetical protein AAGE76_10590 [Pseudomonadota bacterium]
MLFYSMAGAQKVVKALAALAQGDAGAFAPGALSGIVADRVVQTNTEPLLAHFFIGQHWLTMPMYFSVFFVQLFALVAVFRPRLHVAWGYALIGFHMGTWLLMEIVFVQHVTLLALLMVMSPQRRFDGVVPMLAAVPLLGRPFRVRGAPQGPASEVVT